MTLITAGKGQCRITAVTVCEVNWGVQMFNKTIETICFYLAASLAESLPFL